MQTDFKLYKVDMKYIRNLHNIDDKVLSVSPQTGKDNRVFVGIVIICGIYKYCIPLSSPKEASVFVLQKAARLRQSLSIPPYFSSKRRALMTVSKPSLNSLVFSVRT